MRVAFIGFEELQGNLERVRDVIAQSGENIEIDSFTPDKGGVDKAAEFLVSVQGGKLVAQGSTLYLSSATPPEQVKRAQNLKRAGVEVHLGFSEFEADREGADISSWLEHGVWPEPEPEPVDLLSALLDDEPEPESEPPLPTVAPSVSELVYEEPSELLPVPSFTTRSAVQEPEPEEEILLPPRRVLPTRVQEVQEDEPPLPPARSLAQSRELPVVEEDEDDELLPPPPRSLRDFRKVEGSTQEGEQEDIMLPPRRLPPASPLAPAPRPRRPINDDDDEEDFLLPQPPHQQRPRTDSPSLATRRSEPSLDEEFEEEPALPPRPPQARVEQEFEEEPPRLPQGRVQQQFQDEELQETPLPPSRRPLRQAPPEEFDAELERVASAEDEMPGRVPPFAKYLSPQQQRHQSVATQLNREFGPSTGMRPANRTTATVFYTTGSHGGAGKSTVSWLGANTVARALQRAGKSDTPVYLIEADYRNSKLAQRLDLQRGNDSGRYAQFLQELANKRANMTGMGRTLAELHERVIEECIYTDEQSGLRVVACPYELITRQTQYIRLAIQRIVEYAESQGGYVFVDADTLSNDDVLDRNLASKAHHVILVTDVGHMDDMRRSAHTLVTKQSENGMGVERGRINIFFNRTTHEQYEAKKGDALPYSVDGFVPRIEELDGTWVGDMAGGDNFIRAISHIAQFVSGIEPINELEPWKNRAISTKGRPTGFLARIRRLGR